MNVKLNCKILIVLFLAFSNCLWAIKLPDGTDADISTFERYENKKFKSVVFLEALEMEKSFGTFSATEATFYKSGALESLTCEKGTAKTVIGNINVSSRNNVVFFYEKGGLKEMHANNFFISEEYDDGVLADLQVYNNAFITFYPDGKIESIKTKMGKTLMDAHVLNTKYGKLVIFGASEGWQEDIPIYEYEISLYNNGKLKSTTLGTKKIVLDIPEVGKLEVNEVLEFWENGNVKSVHFPKKRTFEVGEEIFSCESLEFYEDGKTIHIVDNGALKFTKDGKIEKEKQGNKKR